MFERARRLLFIPTTGMVLEVLTAGQWQRFLDSVRPLVKVAASAGVAQLVEHQLAMLDVAGSNPVSRSTVTPALSGRRFFLGSMNGSPIHEFSTFPFCLDSEHGAQKQPNQQHIAQWVGPTYRA